MNKCHASLILFSMIVAGCSGTPIPDPIDSFHIAKGMTKAKVVESLGPPQNERAYRSDSPDGNGTATDKPDTPEYAEFYRYRIEQLSWGPYGAHSARIGDITRHRLTVNFSDGKVVSYERTVPNNESSDRKK